MSKPLLPAKSIQAALLRWYDRHKRDLPWRSARHPYPIWVSEIMLQQTRVETVIPFYLRFMHLFPNVRLLADTPPDRVLKAWEGLGYYRRARNLQQAARIVAREYGEGFPQTARAWQALPGIGPYTAAAIASIAQSEPIAALDGNVKRVLARWLAWLVSIDSSQSTRFLSRTAQSLVPAGRPGDFNQAMMDLGAMVCVPLQPRCGDCPVQRYCQAKILNQAKKIPIRSDPARIPHRIAVAGIIFRKGRFLLGQRPEGGLLGGLWEFPGNTCKSGESLPAALTRGLREKLGVKVIAGEPLASVGHAYTHFTVTLHALRAQLYPGILRPRFHTRLAWVSPNRLQDYAMPGVDRKLMSAMRTIIGLSE